MRRLVFAVALGLGACAGLVGIEDDFPIDPVTTDAGSVDAPLDVPADATSDVSNPPDGPEMVCCGCSKEPVAGAENELFKDVGPSAAEAEAVAKLHADGVISGCQTSPPLFCPTCELSRSVLAKWVVLATHTPLFENPDPTFPDVPKNDPAYDYIETAFEYGYMTGFNDGTFQPDVSLTRGAIAVILATTKYEGVVPNTTDHTFADVTPGIWWHASIEALSDLCVTTGCNPEGTMYCPDKLITRRSAAIMLARTFDYISVPCVSDGG